MADSEGESADPESGPKRPIGFPKKYLYRQRAHCNPLSDSFIPYPANPHHVNWPRRYPSAPESPEYLEFNTTDYPEDYSTPIEHAGYPKVSILDVGCGYGGLLVHLSQLYPDKLSMGMEIRDKVTNFVGKRIHSLRQQNPGQYLNISVVRTNSMKFITNYVGKAQLEKMFFCFPDPHFKRSNWRRRIINYSLLSVYAYIMRPGGRLYFVTDVHELYAWMENALEQHPFFKPLSDSEKARDECYLKFDTTTEEGKKNRTNNVTIYKNVYYRT